MMKTKVTLIAIALIGFIAMFQSCEESGEQELFSEGNGTLSLSLTDAPIDDTSVTGVYITVDSLKYHKKNNSWATFEEFEGPQTVNLLDLQDSSILLGDMIMEAGQYNQIRFILGGQENTQGQGQGRGQGQGGPPTSPGCYIEFSGGTQEALFVPSGGQSGYKATGSFRVPTNGNVKVTADFDVRKSVVETGNGRYILKPTIRLIVDDQAGKIVGGVTGLPTDTLSTIIIYAYEDDTYSDSEAAEPGVEENRFPNAVSSDKVCEKDSYHLDYLAPVTYDLVVTKYVDGTFEEVLGFVEDVTVESRGTTNQPIDLSSL